MGKADKVARVIDRMPDEQSAQQRSRGWPDREVKRSKADTRDLLMQECGRTGDEAFLKKYDSGDAKGGDAVREVVGSGSIKGTYHV